MTADALNVVWGMVNALVGIYFLLGIFSNARWLQPDWRRRDGLWVVFPMPRWVRLLVGLMFTTDALETFADAFHQTANQFGLVADVVILFLFLLMWCFRKRISNFWQNGN